MALFCQRLALLIFLFSFVPVKAQLTDASAFKSCEDSCIVFGKQLSADVPDSDKLASNQKLVVTLKKFFSLPGSFNYPLDSLKTFGRLYAPDKSFRLITWNILLANGTYHYYGFIQVFGSTKIFELKDRNDEITNPENLVLSAGKWYGAMYYKMLKNKVDNRTYYTLLALQSHTLAITRKVIDVLFFDEFGNPVFGAPIIQVNKKMKHRLVFEFSASSSVNLNYNENLKMIVFDHVAPAEAKYIGQYEYYGPDLTFDGLVFKKGVWVYTQNLDLRQPFDPAPKRKPLR